MSRRTKRAPEEIAAMQELYGVTVSFRLKRSNSDQSQALDIIDALSPQDKVEYFVRALLSYAGQPIRNDNAATAVELHDMITELLRALNEANQIIDKLSRGRLITDQDKQGIGNAKVTQQFVEKMVEQQRASRVLRQPTDDTDE